jgi:hypothetical protein
MPSVALARGVGCPLSGPAGAQCWIQETCSSRTAAPSAAYPLLGHLQHRCDAHVEHEPTSPILAPSHVGPHAITGLALLGDHEDVLAKSPPFTREAGQLICLWVAERPQPDRTGCHV